MIITFKVFLIKHITINRDIRFNLDIEFQIGYFSNVLPINIENKLFSLESFTRGFHADAVLWKTQLIYSQSMSVQIRIP